MGKASVNPSDALALLPDGDYNGRHACRASLISWPDAAPVALPTCSAPPIPQGPCPVCPRLAQEFEPWRQAAYYKAMLDRAVAREALLKERSPRSRPNSACASSNSSDARPTPRPRPRAWPARSAPHAPADSNRESRDPNAAITPTCPPSNRSSNCQPNSSDAPGADSRSPPSPAPTTPPCWRSRSAPIAGSTAAAAIVPPAPVAHHPGIVTAPPPAKVIPKSLLGVSVWVTVLLDKFLFYRPTYRLLEDLRTQGLDLSQGTLTDGLQRLLPLFEPLYDHLVEHSQEQTLWHADETRWLVFATWEGKVGYRWYLWVFHAADVVVFVLSPGRSHEVPEEHFGPVEEGILVVDRYAAYPAMAQVKGGTIVLAFCWAHVRRDFLTVARSWPDQEAWALGWVERIGVLYACNDRRLEAPRRARCSRPATRRCAGVSRRWPSSGRRNWPSPRCTRRGGRCWRACGTTGRG